MAYVDPIKLYLIYANQIAETRKSYAERQEFHRDVRAYFKNRLHTGLVRDHDTLALDFNMPVQHGYDLRGRVVAQTGGTTAAAAAGGMAETEDIAFAAAEEASAPDGSYMPQDYANAAMEPFAPVENTVGGDAANGRAAYVQEVLTETVGILDEMGELAAQSASLKTENAQGEDVYVTDEMRAVNAARYGELLGELETLVDEAAFEGEAVLQGEGIGSIDLRGRLEELKNSDISTREGGSEASFGAVYSSTMDVKEGLEQFAPPPPAEPIKEVYTGNPTYYWDDGGSTWDAGSMNVVGSGGVVTYTDDGIW